MAGSKRFGLALLFALIPVIGSAQIVPSGQWQGITPPIFGNPSAVTGSGTITSAQLLAPDGSASAPSYSFASETNLGLYKASTGVIAVGNNNITGGIPYALAPTQIRLGQAVSLGWSSADSALTAADVSLSRGAANRLDLATGDSFYLVSGGLGVASAPTATSWITTGAGTTTVAPLTITNGTNLTSAAANTIENDGTAFYQTTNTTNGRAYQDGWNYFRLTGSGTGITTIADFFGANSAIPLVASGLYEIEWNAYFSQATAGTATWTVTTATTALASLTGEYLCSNIAGIQAVGAPQTAAINVTSSSATAFPVTGTEATAVTHYCRIRVLLQAGAGASNTRLRLTMSAGTATPLINSYFRARQLPSANTGTFVP